MKVRDIIGILEKYDGDTNVDLYVSGSECCESCPMRNEEEYGYISNLSRNDIYSGNEGVLLCNGGVPKDELE